MTGEVARASEEGTGYRRGKAPRRYDFARLKRAIGIVEVLVHFGLDAQLREQHGELVGSCPLPGHGGDRDNRRAFRVNPDKGVWRCLSHCGGGDIVELAMLMKGGSYAAAARALVQVEAGGAPVPRHPRASSLPRASATSPFVPYTKRLSLEPDHPLLRARRLDPETCREFEAGWWPLGGFLRSCVAVRLRDAMGNPLGYAGRRVDADEHGRGKWKFPLRLPRAKLLFNWHRACQHARGGLVVVEGPWDAMRVHQAGHRNVVALWGTTASAAQLGLLGQAIRLVLMLDGDAAGRAASGRLAAALCSTPVTTVELSDGRDPADLTDRELRARLALPSSTGMDSALRDRHGR